MATQFYVYSRKRVNKVISDIDKTIDLIDKYDRIDDYTKNYIIKFLINVISIWHYNHQEKILDKINTKFRHVVTAHKKSHIMMFDIKEVKNIINNEKDLLKALEKRLNYNPNNTSVERKNISNDLDLLDDISNILFNIGLSPNIIIER